jgi:hypothetical protein
MCCRPSISSITNGFSLPFPLMLSQQASFTDTRRAKHNLATKRSRKKLNEHLNMLLQLVSNGEKAVVPTRSKVRTLEDIMHKVQKLQERVQLLETKLLLSDTGKFERWLSDLVLAEDFHLLPTLAKVCDVVSQLFAWKVAEIWFAFEKESIDSESKKVTLKLGNSFATNENGFVEKQFIAGFLASSQKYEFDPSHGLPGTVYVNNTPLWLNHLPSNPIFLRAPLAQTFGIYSALGIPFSIFGRTEAVLVFLDYTPRDENQNIAQRLVEIFKALACRVEDTLQRNQRSYAVSKSFSQ